MGLDPEKRGRYPYPSQKDSRHRGTMITRNLVFSSWNQIFKNEVTTAAAIDRLVHHGIILELNVQSYRMEVAQNKERAGEKNSKKRGEKME